jgi:hypothetical protein
MTIRYISIILTEDEDDLSYSFEFASNNDDDDGSIPGNFSLFLLALDIL